MIDYAAILAELEGQEQLDRHALAKTQAGIAAIRPLVNGKKPAKAAKGRTPKVPKTPAGRPAASGRGAPIPADVLAVMKAMYEKGAALAEITKSTGRTTSSIYGQASAGKWKRPKGQGVPSKSAAATTATGTMLAGRVSCPSCHVKTDRDPCQHCGSAVRR